jgi:hypothetical protein
VRRRIETLLASSDPLEQEVGRRLAGRLPIREPLAPATSVAPTRAASRWRHVDLADLLASLGNPVKIVGSRIKAGHEPVHSSKSRSCLVAWPAEGTWWCSSCDQSGDAATLVMQARGMSYREAAAFLAERYGPPAGGAVSRAAVRRRVLRGAVT